MNALKVERYWPVVLAAIAAIVTGAVLYSYELRAIPRAIPAGIMTFGIVVAGFAATQRNMLLTLGGTEVLNRLRTTKHGHDVLDYLMHCVYSGVGLSVVAVLGLLFSDDSALFCWLWLILITFFIALILGSVVRNEVIMKRVVKHFIVDSNHSRSTPVTQDELFSDSEDERSPVYLVEVRGRDETIRNSREMDSLEDAKEWAEQAQRSEGDVVQIVFLVPIRGGGRSAHMLIQYVNGNWEEVQLIGC